MAGSAFDCLRYASRANDSAPSNPYLSKVEIKEPESKHQGNENTKQSSLVYHFFIKINNQFIQYHTPLYTNYMILPNMIVHPPAGVLRDHKIVGSFRVSAVEYISDSDIRLYCERDENF